MADKFEALEQSLEMFIENSRQLGIIVTEFGPQSQFGLGAKINAMMTGMQDIDRMKNQMSDVQIPFEVFEYIDQGKNPQLYTKDCMEKALAKNEAVKGKIDSLRKFRSLLIAELIKVFPTEMAKYKALRGPD